MSAGALAPRMPPFAPDKVGGLGILLRLPRNGSSAFPARCLDHPVTLFPIAGCTLAVLTGPDAMRHVLHGAEAYDVRLPAGRRVFRPIVGRGLLVSEGETWRRQRRAMAPAFTLGVAS